MPRTRLLCLLSAAAISAACGDTVELRDGVDGIVLSYRCEAIRTQARSTAERALIEAYGTRSWIAEGAAVTEEAVAMVAAYDEGDWERFERLVVERLCSDPGIVQPLEATPVRRAPLVPGDEAPSFTLPLLTRTFLDDRLEHLSSAELRGSYVVLAFWSTWCPPCAVEYPELAALNRDFDGRNVTVLGVLHDDSPSEALEYAESFEGGSFRTVVDEDGAVAKAYQVHGLPITAVIDPEGRLVDYTMGWVQGKGDELQARLEALLASEGASRVSSD